MIRINLPRVATTAILIALASSGCAMFGQNGNGNGDDEEDAAIADKLLPNAQKIIEKIDSCRGKPDDGCRNDILKLGLAYYEHKFLDRKPSKRKRRGDRAIGTTEDIVSVALPVVNLKDSEEDRMPAFFPLLRIVRALIGLEDEQAKRAQSESDLLRSKIEIKEKFPLGIKDYSLEEALLDLARYRKKALG
ncbi:MAG: hypothetical protein OXH09_00995 [Gammaproteobacteria bacterium]|nr:hypothetical protein [Gammaproteobacteria bacterium]